MSPQKKFGEELQSLLQRYLDHGTAPEDVVDEISRQTALIIDQNNLELEMIVRPR